MATGSKGYGVTIAAVDQASPTLDKINRRLAALSAPAERFNKSVAKFGDVSGVNRMAEGMSSLGSRSLDVFRSLDRVAPALAGITGAASLAGMTALVQRWSQLGQQTYMVGQRLGIPVDKLTGLQGAAKEAGLGVKALDDGMGALREKITNAAFGKDENARSMFTSLGIDIGNMKDGAADAGEVFGKVADGIKRLNEAKNGGLHASQHAADELGVGALWPLLVKGSAGIKALTADVGNLGGIISPEAAKRADELETSFARLGIALDGVANRLGDKWGAIFKPWIDGATEAIAKNHDLGLSYGEIGVGITALMALPGVVKLSRLLGITTALNGAVLASPLLLSGDTDPNATADGAPSWAKRGGFLGRGGTVARWFGSTDWANPSERENLSSTHAASSNPRGIRNNNPLNLSYLPGQGASGSDGRFGTYPTMADGVAASERQLLRYQDQGDNTLRKIISRWAPPGENDTEAYIADASRRTGFDQNYPLDMRDPDQAQRVIGAMGHRETGQNIDPRAIQAGVDQGINGRVQVDVNLKNAPPGTTATATASGSATAAPPRVETAMQH